MNLDLSVVFSSLIGLFLLIITGMLAVKWKVFPASASGAFAALLLNIALPCTIFTSMLRPFDPTFLTDSLVTGLVSGGLFLANFFLTIPLARLFRVSHGSRGVWRLTVTFCNNGFMGFPVSYALFGDEGLALAAIIGIPFNFLLYSLGVLLVCRDMTGQTAQPLNLRRVLVTPINASVVLGLTAYITQVPIPESILSPISFLSAITTPLSMVITGMALAAAKFLEIVRNRDVITASFSRLLIMPGFAWAVMGLLPFSNPLIPSVTLIILSMPAPGISATLAERYGGNRDLAAQVTVLTSLCCILTIPFFAMLL